MTQKFSAASIYGIIDRMDAPAITSWLKFHQRMKYPPRFINVFTAARFNDAPNILRQVRDSLPLTTPVWRGFDGKDAWGNQPQNNVKWNDSNFYLNLWNSNATTAKMAAGIWFNGRVKPYLDVIRETKSIVHLLNEATPVFNAPFETECIRLLGEEGIRAGAFAWTAGAPDWADYRTPAILEEIDMAGKYNALVMTHEYAGVKPEEQNSLINRYSYLTNLFKVRAEMPDVFLGEFGLAKATVDDKGQIHLDPDRGWREMGVPPVQYMEFIKGAFKAWYFGNKVSFSIYCGPDWGHDGSFGVMQSSELLDLLAGASEWMCFEVPLPQPFPIVMGQGDDTPAAPVVIMTRPAEAKIGIRQRIVSIPSGQRNLRDSWNYTATQTGTVNAGDIVRRFDIPVCDGQYSPTVSGKWCFVEVLDGDVVTASGWLARDNVVWANDGFKTTQEVPAVTPAPAELPAPDPIPEHIPDIPAAPARLKMTYHFEIETTSGMHSVIEQALMGMVMSISALGQALGGSTVKLVTTEIQ